jgi:hypothetical protein
MNVSYSPTSCLPLVWPGILLTASKAFSPVFKANPSDAQLQTALQHHLTSTTLGSLPLHPYLPSTSTSVPEPNPSDINADAPITTTHPDTTTTQRQAMGMPDFVAWAEKRAERDFERREGIRDTAKVVLDALRLR